jgi:VanZ family protein
MLPLFWLTLFAVYGLAIMPPAAAPAIGNDKVQHMAAFLTLAVLASLALPKLSVWMVGLVLALFGGLIELTQMIPALHRDASVYDWLADCAAIVAGLAIATRIRRVVQDAR